MERLSDTTPGSGARPCLQKRMGVRLLAACLLLHVGAAAATAGEWGRGTATFGGYTYHVSNDENFNEFPWLLGFEWENSKRWAAGAAYFENSFHQSCGYLYVQKRFVWGDGDDGWFLKIPFGLLYGYKPPHEHAVPFNYGGFSPGIAPIVGYKYRRFTAEAVVFGSLSGIIAVVGYDLWE